ncbi:MAG: GntR family transcriptional regulator [Enterobacteriaceae bacterium]
MKTKAKVIYLDLKQKIFSGDLPEGTRLLIHQIAEQYQSSDIPVREALKELAAEDLIEMTPHRGSHVKRVSAKEMRDIVEVRKILDPLAARLAAENATPELVAALERVHSNCEQLARQKKYDDYFVANHEFHQLIIDGCGNSSLKKLLGELMQSERYGRQFFVHFPDRLESSLQQHREMIQLIEQKKGEEVAELMAQHNEESLTQFLELFSS